MMIFEQHLGDPDVVPFGRVSACVESEASYCIPIQFFAEPVGEMNFLFNQT